MPSTIPLPPGYTADQIVDNPAAKSGQAIPPPPGYSASDVVDNPGFQPSAQKQPSGLLDEADKNPVLGSLDQFGKGIYQTAVQPVQQLVTHPIDTLSSLPGNLLKGEQSMIDNANRVGADPNASPIKKFDAALYLIPGIGPVLKGMDDLNAQGKTAQAYGQATGLLASIYGPKALEGTGAAEATEGAEALKKPVTPVSEGVSRYVNQHIGLQPSDLSKYGRLNPEVPQEIGSTVYKETGMEPNLVTQKAAIDNAITNRLAKTQDILRNADATTPPVDLHHVLIDSAVNLTDELEKAGATKEQLEAVDKNLQGLEATYAKTVKPSEALEARKAISSRITTWDPNTTNIQQRYLQDVYHSINDAVHETLAPEDAAAFRENNRTVHNLIIASNAAGEKLSKAGMKASGPAKIAGSLDIQHPLSNITRALPEGRDLQIGIGLNKAVNAAKGAATATKNAATTAAPGIARFTQATNLLGGFTAPASKQQLKPGDPVTLNGHTGVVERQHENGKAIIRWN